MHSPRVLRRLLQNVTTQQHVRNPTYPVHRTMAGPFKSFLRTAAVSLLTLAPPPRVSGFLRAQGPAARGRLLGPRGQSQKNAASPSAAHNDPYLNDGPASSKNPSSPQRVVVLGGGFGGVYTALRLEQLARESGTPVDVTVVDRKDRFVFLPLLYELATGQASMDEVAPRFEGLLTGLNFVQGAATAVDLDNRRVTIESPSVATPHAPEAAASATTTTTTADEPATEEAAASSTSAANSENAPPTSTTSLQFDRLIVALGSEAADLGNVPGAAEHALPFYTLEHAEQLQKEITRLDALLANKNDGTPASVCVVGGSYSGVELAVNLAKRLNKSSSSSSGSSTSGNNMNQRAQITLLHSKPQLLPASGEPARRRAEAALAAAGVSVKRSVRVQEVRPSSVVVGANAGGEEVLPADLVVWTAGSKPALGALFENIVEPASGRIPVSESLAVEGSNGVCYALGDNAVCPAHVPASAQVAFQQSEYAAYNVWASLSNQKQLGFRYTPLGEMMSLGAGDASVSGPDQLPVNVGGPVGALARRLVYAVRMPTADQRRVAITGLINAALEATTDAATAAAASATTAEGAGGSGIGSRSPAAASAAVSGMTAAAAAPMERWLKKSSV